GRGALVAVEGVAERDDFGGAGALDVAGEAAEGHGGVVGREQRAALRIGAQLFKVQVGDEQRVFGRPEERSRGERLEHLIGKTQEHPCRFLVVAGGPHRRLESHVDPVASRINSSAASAMALSRASPWTGTLPMSTSTGTAKGEIRSRGLWTMCWRMRRSIWPSRSMSSRPR